MKKMIVIESDSDNELSPDYEYPKRDEVIRLVRETKTKTEHWDIDAKLKQFSPFLQSMDIENGEGNVLMTVYLPKTLAIRKSYLKMIEYFYWQHQFKQESIILKKITMEGFKKGLDEVSVVFLEEHLQKKKDRVISKLLKLCQYFKFSHLKELINIYIASQHFRFYNETAMQDQISKQQAFFSRQEEINIKRQLKSYAQQVSKDLLVNFREKKDKAYNNTSN